jgi:carboxyl-terminal processing protease
VLACLALAPVAAQQNLSFEQLDAGAAPVGWSLGDAGVTIDATIAADGEHSLKLTRAGAGVTRVTQRVSAARLRSKGDDPGGQRLRLAGVVQTTGGAAALWLRIDGPRGPLFLDSYGYGREPAGAAMPASGGKGSGGAGWRRYELELPLPSDVDEVAFGVSLRGEGTAWFDGLELAVVPTDSWSPAAPIAVRYIDAALDIMREHALRRADVDWSAMRAQTLAHARGARTVAETHVAIRFAVRELGDRHSYLQSPAVSRVLQTTAVANARTGAAATVPRATQLGNVAYLHVPSFAGGTQTQQVEFAETLKSLAQHHDEAGVCGWVVDLRQNTGGNLWPMLAGLGPLLGEGEVAASVYPDGRRIPVWHRDGQAGFGDYTQLRVRAPYRLRAARPIAVLIGPATASSAEVLAVALLGRDGTRSFGAATRGLSAGNRTFSLADGASLVLTVAATSDAAGRVFAGPLAPDELVPSDRGMRGTGEPSDPALDAAMVWLTARDSCS